MIEKIPSLCSTVLLVSGLSLPEKKEVSIHFQCFYARVIQIYYFKLKVKFELSLNSVLSQYPVIQLCLI